MKSVLFKTIGTFLVATCVLVTPCFANSQQPSNSVTMETCSAKDIVGEYPQGISESHRNTLDGAIGRIDMYNASGDYDKVNKLWKIVDEILDSYQNKSNSNSSTSTTGDYMSFDDFIKNNAPTLPLNDQNILRGYFNNVISAYQSGDQTLIAQADQAFFATFNQMINSNLGYNGPNYGGPGYGQVQGTQPATDHYDIVLHDLPADLDPIVRQHIIDLVDEIRHFDSVHNYSVSDPLRVELEQILDFIAENEH